MAKQVVGSVFHPFRAGPVGLPGVSLSRTEFAKSPRTAKEKNASVCCKRAANYHPLGSRASRPIVGLIVLDKVDSVGFSLKSSSGILAATILSKSFLASPQRQGFHERSLCI